MSCLLAPGVHADADFMVRCVCVGVTPYIPTRGDTSASSPNAPTKVQQRD